MSTSTAWLSYIVPNVTAGLVNWWKFDENAGATAADSVGGATGTLSGATLPSWVPGKLGSGLSFDGSSSLVQLAANSGAGAGAFSICAWLSPAVSNELGGIFYDTDNDVSGGFIFYLNGGLELIVPRDDTDLFKLGHTRCAANQFTHVVATYDGSLTAAGVHLYLNGVEETQYDTFDDGSGLHNANTTANRNIGGGGFHQLSKFNGIIDEVRVYNRSLSLDEINTIYQWRGYP